MKNTGSMWKRLLSILCVIIMVSVVFSTVMKNVTANGNEEEISVVSLNPDVAVGEGNVIHVVWQENLTGKMEIYFVNDLGVGNFEGVLRETIEELSNPPDNDSQKALENLNDALEKCLKQDYKHSIDNVHGAVKNLEKTGNTELIHTLIDAVMDFAKTNILYAEYNLTFNNSYIQEAYQKYYLAVEKYEQNNYDAAIKQFKNSYLKIVEAYEENNTVFDSVDFGKIVRISYTDFDSVLPSIYLNGTISVSWVEIFENSSHLMYARSKNNGVTWWYFDMNKHYGEYLSLIRIELPELPGFRDIIDSFLDFRELLENLRKTLGKFKEKFKDWLAEAGITTPIHVVEKPIGDGGLHGIIEIIIESGGGSFIPSPPPDPKPDLIVTDISSLNNQSSEGYSIILSAIISNIGSPSASGAKASVYVNGSLLTTVENMGLGPFDGQYQINVPWNISLHGGVYNVTVIADPFNDLEEKNEFNNKMSKPISVLLKFSKMHTGTYNNAIINGTTAPDAVQNVTVSWDIITSTSITKTTTTETTKTIVDTTKPTISSINPSDWQNGWSEVSATITDDSQVEWASAWITTDSNPIIDKIKSKGYSMSGPSGGGSWEVGYTDSFSDGGYYVWIAAGDGHGNPTKNYATVKLDKTPPNNPTECAVNGVTSGVWQNSVGNPTFTWSRHSDSYSGINKFYYYFGSNPSGTSENYVSSPTYSTTVSSGTYYLRVMAQDLAGNFATSWTDLFTFKYDGTAPTTYDNAPTTWQSSDVTVTLSASDAHSGVDAIYTQGNWVSGKERSIQITTEGEHTIYYYSRDILGNLESQKSCWVGIDKTAPNNPSSILSSNPSKNVWTNDNTIEITWSEATDPCGEIDGYYYKWTTNNNYIPTPSDSWTIGRSVISNALADGDNWYLCVRAKDKAGHLANGAYCHGPFKIDTNGPLSPTVSSAHDQNIWSSNNDPSFSWTKPSDVSDIVGFYYILDKSSTTVPTEATGNRTTSNSKLFVDVPDGIWYFHIRAKDGAGNSGLVAHYRVKIDTGGGTVVEILSPANNSWVNNSKITFVWRAHNLLSGLSGNYNIQISSYPDFSSYTNIDFSGTSVNDEDNLYTHTFSDDGTYYWQVSAQNALEKWGNYVTGSFSIDTIKPTLNSIMINSGATYTTDRTVTISVDASDDRSDLSKICFSNDNVDWSGWFDIGVSSWLLPSGDGEKTVYVKVRDKAGNIALNIASDKIKMDLTLPKNPDSCTESHNVESKVWQSSYSDPSFSWYGASDTNSIEGYYYYWGDDPYGTSSSWTTGTSYPSTISVTSGIYYLRIAAVDVPGNIANWQTIFVFKYDTQAPTDLSLMIDDGSGYTNTVDVVLSLSAFDAGSGVGGMMISEDPNFSGLSWESFSFSKTWTLSDGVDGEKTIYFRVKDRLGHLADISAPITLDRNAPGVPSLSSPGNDTATCCLNPTFTWGSVSDSSGIKYYIIQTYQMGTDRIIRNKKEFISTTTSNTTSLDIGNYYYRIRAVDNAGNAGEWSETWGFAVSNKPYIVYISVDNGYTWQEIEQGANYNFEWSGMDLMYKIVLVDPEAGTNVNVSITVIYGFLSDFADQDDDGLSDWEEAANYGTSWNDPDCDDDGLKDGEEINTYGTDPKDFDTDNDRILDGSNQTLDVDYGWRDERRCEDDWTDAGIYHVDGVWLGELSYGINANDSDTDNDDMLDGWEAYYGTNATYPDANEDYDYDNLTNIQEYYNKTHPNNPDTDYDGLIDFDEIVMGTNPLCDDSDNDGLIDGVDNQPMAWWDMGWKFRKGYLPEDVVDREFAVLTKKQPHEYELGYPSKEEIQKALRTQDHPDVEVLSAECTDYLYVPTEIYPKVDVFEDADNEHGGQPRYEYRMRIQARNFSDIENYYYTMFEWVFEPDADQKISFQVTFDKSLDKRFGFVMNLYEIGNNGSYSDISYSTLYGVGNNLTGDNKSYGISVQIPWNCVPLSPEKVLIGLRPVFIDYDLDANGTLENVNLTSLNTVDYGLKIASVQAEVVKNPCLIAVRPDLDFEDFVSSLPSDPSFFSVWEFYDHGGNYFGVDYTISRTYYASQRGFWGPVCVKEVMNATTGELLAFVVNTKFLADVENYKNSSSYLWSNLNNGLPVVNMSMKYDHNLIFVKALRDEVNNSVVCCGDPNVVRVQSGVNSTQIYVINDTALGLYFYVRSDLHITFQNPMLESLPLMQDFWFTFGTDVNERSEYSKSLLVSKDKVWIDSKVAGKVATIAIIIITGTRVAIAIHEGNYFMASLYTAEGALLIGGIQISQSTRLSPGVAKGIGIGIAIAVFCIEMYPLAMKCWNAQSGEFRTLYALTIIQQAMIFVLQLAVYILVSAAVTLVAGPLAGMFVGWVASAAVGYVIDWLISSGYFDLDTPQGIVITILGGPIAWISALIQEQQEEIEGIINMRTTEWVRNRQQEGLTPLIIR